MRKKMRLALPPGSRAGLGALAVGGRVSATNAAVGAAPVAAQTCRTADLNPVTGHALCINPLGARGEAPPTASELPCKTEARTSEART